VPSNLPFANEVKLTERQASNSVLAIVIFITYLREASQKIDFRNYLASLAG